MNLFYIKDDFFSFVEDNQIKENKSIKIKNFMYTNKEKIINKLCIIKRNRKTYLGIIKFIENKNLYIKILSDNIKEKTNLTLKSDFNSYEFNNKNLYDISEEVISFSFKNIFVYSVNEYLEIINNLKSFEHSFKEKKALFRGQINSEWELQPSIFRDEYNENKDEKGVYRTLEKHLVSEYTDEKEFINNYINMQHYTIPTRLLDWTDNPLKALFFSASPLDNRYNGKVFCHIPKDIVKFQQDKKYYNISKYASYILRSGIDFSESYEFIYEYMKENNPYIFFDCKLSNPRIKAQDGYFSIYLDFLELIKENFLKKYIDIKKPRININLFSSPNKIKGLDKEKYFDYLKTFYYDEEFEKNKKFFSNIYKISTIQKNKFSIDDNVFEIIINKDTKCKILKELKYLGIHPISLFPDMDGYSLYIKNLLVGGL